MGKSKRKRNLNKQSLAKSKKSSKNLLERFQEYPLMKWLGALILGFLIAGFGHYISLTKPAPIFDVKDAALNPSQTIIIQGKNSSAQKKCLLDVRWEGMTINGGIKPYPDEKVYEWHLTLSILREKGFPVESLKDGKHKLEVGFNGKYYPISDIYLDSKAPIGEFSLGSSPHNPKEKILVGHAADERQDPNERIKVDIIFFNESSESQTYPLSVKREVDNNGRVSFHFKTSIENLPDISPDNPAYGKKFFGFQITDQAGNNYWHAYDYAQFAAPGRQFFKTGNIADIEVKKQHDLERHSSYVIFKVKPSPKWQTKYKGRPALSLKVFAHTIGEAELVWKNLPNEIRSEKPVTTVYRDDGKIDFVIGKNTFTDKSIPPGKKVSYKVAQKDKHGDVYVSNKAGGELETNPKPKWADNQGIDQYGTYADFSINEVVQRMRWIKPGRFMMGSPKDEKGRRSNETQHEVILTEGFWLADTTCTQELWQSVMGDNPSRFKGPQRPVERVSWDDCQKFVKTIKRLKPGLDLGLPSEAQWEYACRAGTKTPFWFGENITTEQVNYNGEYPYADGKKGKNRKETVDVKSLPCNGWGLYQMHGNVWEWCADWYGEYSANSIVNPTGPDKGEGRVLRGGCWILDGRYVRSAFRFWYVPGDRLNYLGPRFFQVNSSTGRKQAGKAAGKKQE